MYMKSLLHYFKRTRKELRLLLFVSIAGYFLIVFLNNFPQIFPGANKIGEFFSKLSMAYITSFVFYFIVVHIKNEKDKENINEFISIQLSEIITCGHLYFQPFIGSEKYKDTNIITLPDEVFKSVNRFAPESFYTKSNGEKYTWIECYEFLKRDTLKAIDIIHRRYNHLDTKLIKLLSRIENSMLYYQWSLLYDREHSQTFELYSLQLKTYYVAIQELKKYADKNFKPAAQIRGEFMRVHEVLKY